MPTEEESVDGSPVPLDAAGGGAPAPQAPGEAEPRDVYVIALVGSALAGALGSIQGRMNGELSALTHEPVEAAVWSFGSGLVILTVVVLLAASVRRGLSGIVAALRGGSLRWWQVIGGTIGGLYVAVQSYAVPLVGVALFTVAVVAGQTGNGLVVDRLGIGPGGPKPVHVGRAAAAVLAIVGVVVSVWPRLGGHGLVLLPVVLSLLMGGGSALQMGINGRVNLASRNVLSTTWVNFGMGTAMLLVVALVKWAASDLHPAMPHGVPWWAWLGGVCGIGFIGTAAWAVRHLGVLVFGLALLTGQLSAAVVLDLVSPATRGDVTPAVVLGVLVTFVAAGLASWFARRDRTAA